MSGLPGSLYQDRVWVDGQGVTHRLDEMDRHHRANLIPFLRGNANALQRAAEANYWASALAMVDDPSDGVADAMDAIEAEFLMPAEDWLESIPLMRRLVELEHGRPLADRALTAVRNRAHELRTGYQKVRLG